MCWTISARSQTRNFKPDLDLIARLGARIGLVRLSTPGVEKTGGTTIAAAAP